MYRICLKIYYFTFFLNKKLRNSKIFITIRKTPTIPKVKYGLVGAIVARIRIGKPNTIAGKF